MMMAPLGSGLRATTRTLTVPRHASVVATVETTHEADGWRHRCFGELAARDWASVDSAMRAAVAGHEPLPGDVDAEVEQWPQEDEIFVPDGARLRQTWLLRVAYAGADFSGFAWQRDPKLPTVSGCLQEAISPLLEGRNSLRLSCAGRTDAGVSALGQLVSFYSWAHLDPTQLKDEIAAAGPAPGSLRVLEARRVSRSFHATFSTSWRRYAYLLPRTPGMSPMDVADEAREIDRVLQPLAGAPGMPRWNRPSHTPIAYAHFVRQWLMSIPYADSIRRFHTPIAYADRMRACDSTPPPAHDPTSSSSPCHRARLWACSLRRCARLRGTRSRASSWQVDGDDSAPRLCAPSAAGRWRLRHASRPSGRPLPQTAGGRLGPAALPRCAPALCSRAALPRCAPALRSRARRLSCMRASSRSRHAASCGTAECHHGNGT